MIGILALFAWGAISGILTDRQFGMGMIACLLLPVLAGSIRKIATKNV